MQLTFLGFVSAIAAGLAHASSSTSTHVQYAIRSGQVKSIGVNIGGWLVAENWMTWDSPLWNNVSSTALGEYQAMQALGRTQGQVQFKNHWDTWITELDIKLIAAAGFNMVRVPVGYWIISCSNYQQNVAKQCNGYAQGGLPYLDKLIREWGLKYNVAVLISVHGAPGSQNGADHSGSIDGGSHWSSSYDYIQATRTFVKVLAARYKSDDAFLGIGLLNEPGGTTSQSTMEQYYYDVYYDVRTVVGSDCILVTMPLLWNQNRGSGPAMEYFASYMKNVWHEWHPYLIWGHEGESEADLLVSAAAWKQQMQGWQGHPLFLGEWSFVTAGANNFQTDASANTLYNALFDMVDCAQGGWALWSWHIAGNNPWNRWNVKGMTGAYDHTNNFGWNDLPNASEPISIARTTTTQRLDFAINWVNKFLVKNDAYISVFGVTDVERWVYYPTTSQFRSDRTTQCLDGYLDNGAFGAHQWYCDPYNDNQKWKLVNHTLFHPKYNRCLGIYENGTTTLVVCDPTDPAQFYTTTGVSRIVAPDGTYLVATGVCSTSSLSTVKESSDTSDEWLLQLNTSMIVNTLTGECLDAFQPQDGGVVHTWTCDATNRNQKWIYDATTSQLRHFTHESFCLDFSYSPPALKKCSAIDDTNLSSQKIQLQWVSYPALPSL
ncbi:unnamed protein product [Aphanomyces euteiches]|uniref:glucan 1,3-beta-glucosidase n=1 Tax=Aphanomyces euteiches TaxID=100861 RepID=A0A6G0WZK6_9STRA|nr:hypothetical protein Ae201684_010063 [Aphanomyces euteiches]KAH9134117.1 hypothetical protein AeRB84_020010 [Aphanomyces euteiches]